MDELIEEIVEELSIELKDDVNFDEEVLTLKVRNAYREVKRARQYPSSYTSDAIASDIENYYMNIKNIALYDYNQRGAEFETSHDENGTDRDFMEREKLFTGILPFAKMF